MHSGSASRIFNFSGGQELAVKMQLYVAVKLALIYSGVMFCTGTQ